MLARLLLIGGILWVGYTYLSAKFGLSPVHNSQINTAAGGDVAQSTSGDAAANAPVEKSAETAAPRQERAVDGVLQELPAKATDSAVAKATTLASDPQADPRVADAMTEAASSGQPVRWHSHHLHGYAVPSAPDATGCRMVQVSIDKTGEQSSAIKMCP